MVVVAAALTAAGAAAFTGVPAQLPTVLTAAMVANGPPQCPVTVDPAEWVQDRRRLRQEDRRQHKSGAHLHCLALMLLQDGTGLVDQGTAPARLVDPVAERPQLTKWRLPTVSGTPSEAPTPQVDRLLQPTPTSPATPHSRTPPGVDMAVGAVDGAVGVVVGVIPPSALAGDVGAADGDLVLDGASAGVLTGVPIGRSIPIPTGTASGGPILISILRPPTFTRILTRTRLTNGFCQGIARIRLTNGLYQRVARSVSQKRFVSVRRETCLTKRFVSGHRFSDAAKLVKSDAPLGAG